MHVYEALDITYALNGFYSVCLSVIVKCGIFFFKIGHSMYSVDYFTNVPKNFGYQKYMYICTLKIKILVHYK